MSKSQGIFDLTQDYTFPDPDIVTKTQWFADVISSGLLSKNETRIFAHMYKRSKSLNYPVTDKIHDIADCIDMPHRKVWGAVKRLRELRLIFAYRSGKKNGGHHYWVIFQDLISLKSRIELQERGLDLIGLNPSWITVAILRPASKRAFAYVDNLKTFPHSLFQLTPKTGVYRTPEKGVTWTPETGVAYMSEKGAFCDANQLELINFDAKPSLSLVSTSSLLVIENYISQNIKCKSVRKRNLAQVKTLARKYGEQVVLKAFDNSQSGEFRLRAAPTLGEYLQKHIEWFFSDLARAHKEKTGAQMRNLLSPIVLEVREGIDKAEREKCSEGPNLSLNANAVLQNIGFDLGKEYRRYFNQPRKGVLDGIEAEIWCKAQQKYKF